MKPVSEHEIRLFRLRRHRLDAHRAKESVLEAAGACGLQNSPPGAWETALFNRAPGCSLEDIDRLLYKDKTLLQAWSLRGAPYVIPAAQSEAFLSSLIPREGEERVCTKGIGPARGSASASCRRVARRSDTGSSSGFVLRNKTDGKG